MSDMEFQKEMSINEWTRMFKTIYFSTQNYRRPANEICLHLVKVFGGGSHYLFRANDPSAAKEYLAKIFGWYCALAIRLKINIEEALWSKYPGVCPRCLDNVCKCGENPNDIDVEKLAMLALERIHQKPSSLREWQAMFQTMYRGPRGKEAISPSREKIAMIFSRMAEELGEVAEAILLDPAIDEDADEIIKNEMADFCAWIFALANNLQFIDPTAKGTALADVAWDFYPGKCHRCLEEKCVCVRGTYKLELAEKGAMGPSHWDERTGLANDKALSRYIRYSQNQFSSGNMQWSMIFMDLDNFGLVNKTHGHPAGDEVLRIAAKRIQECCGDKGVAFRRGGEEFIVVLNAQHRESLFIAEDIRRNIFRAPVTIHQNGTDITIPISASLGVASCGVDSLTPTTMESISEKRARQAKSNGKNCVFPPVTKEILDEFLAKTVFKRNQ